jgi:outer membrane protein OmpA-like peptidoglycan-associated protein
MKLILLIFIALIATFSFSQNRKAKKADVYFSKLSYSKAIPLYLKMVDSKLNSPQIQAKLAYSFFQIGNISKSVEFYSLAFSASQDFPKDYFFYYAQALKQTGNYAESDKWMSVFYHKDTADLRAISYWKSTDYLGNIQSMDPYAKIEAVSFNSPFADFGGYSYTKKEEVLFVSARKPKLNGNKWTWNGENYLDYFAVKNQVVRKKSNGVTRKLNSNFHEGPLCFNSDESMVYFTRNNLSRGKSRRDSTGIQNLKLCIADVTPDGSFVNIRELAINSKNHSVGHPTISADGKTLYFVSDMPGGFGGADIYKASILPNGEIVNPINLGDKINTEGQEMFPWVTADGVLCFSSDGHIGLGGLDVFFAPMQDAGMPVEVYHGGPFINSERDDFAFILNKDGKNGYLSSNRGENGDDNIFSFNLLKPLVFGIQLNGVLSDELTADGIAGATIYLLNQAGEIVDSTTTDANGKYQFTLQQNENYRVRATYKDRKSETFDVAVSTAENATISQKIKLLDPPATDFQLFVINKESKQGIQDVKIHIKEVKSGRSLAEQITNSTGNAHNPIPSIRNDKNTKLELKFSKQGYLTKKIQVDENVSNSEIQAMKIELIPLRIGMNLAELVNINPILFDLNKSDIRKDAQVELDKIVEILNDNPTLEVELGSHTDCRSSYDYNMKLSDSRAKASAAYVRARITNAKRIYGKGYGESKLKLYCPCEGTIKNNCLEEEHQQNRRTEFVLRKL